MAELEIHRVGYGHPDAMRLIDEVQAEYVVRYGGPDETPLDPLMFEPPSRQLLRRVRRGAGRSPPVPGGAPPSRPSARRAPPRSSGCTSPPPARGRGLARLMLAHLEAERRRARRRGDGARDRPAAARGDRALRVQRLRRRPGVRPLQGRADLALLRPASADHDVALVVDRPAPVRRVVQRPRGSAASPAPSTSATVSRRGESGAGRPAALDQHQPPVGRQQPHPPGQRGGRVGERPQDVTAQHDVVRALGAAAGPPASPTTKLVPGNVPALAVARRTISGERSTPSTRVPLLGEQQRERARAAAEVGDPGRDRRQQRDQQAPPGVADERVVQPVVRLVVEAWRPRRPSSSRSREVIPRP